MTSSADDGAGGKVVKFEPQVQVVQEALDAPAPVKPIPPPDPDPPPGEARHGIAPGQWTGDELGLPDGCPVTPLGVDGDLSWFLDTIGQVRSIPASRFGQGEITNLFMGRAHYLYWAFPRFNAKGQVTAWRAEKVRECLMGACARRGPWNSVERVRGRGAWRGNKGGLILHTGTELWANGRELATGDMGALVYPKRPPLSKPWDKRIAADDPGHPARVLLPLFRRWEWARPTVDPLLLLGWIGVAFLGGALPWRPIVYWVGDTGTGKSTLQGLVKAVLGDWLVQSSDTTAAGIYQRVNKDSVPVAVDELEAEADNRKVRAVLNLARKAASGDLMLRGGSEHQGTEFQARSAFAFSSINAPPLESQDLSRMALLRLGPLDLEARALNVDEENLVDVGRKVLRLLVENWHRYHATYESYAEQLKAGGHSARGQKTFGVLLACADMIIDETYDDVGVPMGEDLTPWRTLLAADALPELEDALPNWHKCLNHLLSAPVEAWRGGGKLTIGRVLQQFMDREEGATYVETRSRLEQAGVGLVKPEKPGEPHWLAVPNQDPILAKLFAGSTWGGEVHAGVWAGALRQAPPTLWEGNRTRINGCLRRCTLISLQALYGAGGMMAERRRED